MIYVLAALLPPVGLLLNGQPFSAVFNLILIVICVIFGLFFHILLLVPSAHAIITIYIVLGMLYESIVHPLTILSTLPSAGVRSAISFLKLLACMPDSMN